MTMIPPLIAAIGSVLAVLITGFYTIILFNRRKQIERERVSKAIAAEIHRLLKFVIPSHKGWWQHCKASNDVDLPLIPFTTPIYDEHAKNIGMLDDDFVAPAASFYGYIKFLNALQQSREGHIGLKKLPIIVATYEDALDAALQIFKDAFVNVFKRYGLP